MADIFQIVENNGTPKDIGDSKARANIAPTFDVSKANEIGDLVLSDTGILYRFNAAYTAGTSWNSRISKEIVNIAEIKASLDSPAFTGIPTAPTAIARTNNTQIATTAYTNNAIAPIKSDIGIVEDTNIATHTITAGQYVVWKENLYTANNNIAIGTELSISNLTRVQENGIDIGGLNSLINSLEYSTGFFTPNQNINFSINFQNCIRFKDIFIIKLYLQFLQPIPVGEIRIGTISIFPKNNGYGAGCVVKNGDTSLSGGALLANRNIFINPLQEIPTNSNVHIVIIGS